MDKKEMLAKLKALNSAIEDYLDQLDMEDGDEPEKKKSDKKEDK